MLSMLSTLARVRVTAGYAVMLTAVAVILTMLGPEAQDAATAGMSTNLHNLAHGQLDTLVGSAFITGPFSLSLLALACLLALAELFWRGGRLIVAFGVGHVGATLIVAVGLAAGVWLGWLPTSIALASDVGVSYGAAAVLGALTAAIPARYRPAWTGWWLAVAVQAVLVIRDFTAVGHLVALMLGMALSSRFGYGARWTPVRLLLLLIGAVTVYVMLTGSDPSAVSAPLAGIPAALGAQWVARRLGADGSR